VAVQSIATFASRGRLAKRRTVTGASSCRTRWWSVVCGALVMVICGAGAGRSASAEEPPVCGKHLVVLYDFSWRTLERIGRPAVANQRLMDLLFGHGQSVPAWAPGDCISFYSFGMDRDDVEARLPSVPSAEFWRRWNHTLLHQANGSPLQTTDETRARTFLAQNLPSPSTATYWYSLSYYAVPTLVASWPQAYAATTYVFWLSDFFPDYGELRELDEGLVHSRLPMHAATLGRLRTEFEPWEGRLRTIFHSGDELRGWHLAVLEVRPPPLSLDFPDSARLLQTSASGWQLELRAWPSLPTGWRCDKLDLELAEGGGGRIVRRWSASSAETSLALQVAPNSAVRPDGPPLELRGVARLRFVLPGSLGLTLYTTRVIRQATVAVSFLPPLWQRIGRILLVPFIVVVCLLLVAFGRRTRWRLHLGTAELPIEPDLFQSVGHPISVLPWGRNRRYTIRIRIINASDRLNLRRPMPLILLDKVDRVRQPRRTEG